HTRCLSDWSSDVCSSDLIWLVSIAGAFGCVVGSLAAYWVGMYGGRPLIEKYGRYVLISHHDLDLADRWFARFGEIIVFASRLLRSEERRVGKEGRASLLS